MDNVFNDKEKLYRAIYPASIRKLFWKSDGTLSSAAFKDTKGLSVERGYFRENKTILDEMKDRFSGCIISVLCKDCCDAEAIVEYLPSKNNKYHSEIHGSKKEKVLNAEQSLHLAKIAKLEYVEK